jgi:hypothetical protein
MHIAGRLGIGIAATSDVPTGVPPAHSLRKPDPSVGD